MCAAGGAFMQKCDIFSGMPNFASVFCSRLGECAPRSAVCGARRKGKTRCRLHSPGSDPVPTRSDPVFSATLPASSSGCAAGLPAGFSRCAAARCRKSGWSCPVWGRWCAGRSPDWPARKSSSSRPRACDTGQSASRQSVRAP